VSFVCCDVCPSETFEDSGENKLEYTTLFNEYQTLVEGLLQQKLSEKIEGFQMEDFERMLEDRRGECFAVRLGCMVSGC
jgi:hypothetical protein